MCRHAKTFRWPKGVFNHLHKDIRGYLLHLVENIGKPRTSYYFHSHILDEHFGLIFLMLYLEGHLVQVFLEPQNLIYLK
jgi:hypothetical protein